MSKHDHDNRDRKVIATVACPTCHAKLGEPCRPKPGKMMASRTCSERRTFWKMVRDGEVK